MGETGGRGTKFVPVPPDDRMSRLNRVEKRNAFHSARSQVIQIDALTLELIEKANKLSILLPRLSSAIPSRLISV